MDQVRVVVLRDPMEAAILDKVYQSLPLQQAALSRQLEAIHLVARFLQVALKHLVPVAL